MILVHLMQSTTFYIIKDENIRDTAVHSIFKRNASVCKAFANNRLLSFREH